jgi:aminoglycoside phosphotransferase family enzyme
MSPPLPPLIKALLDPARYPHPAAHVELIETHASWLLLAGDFAYKIKKPVVLPFLDYGTLERRRACCEAELRLNRRFAPQLYLAVLPIVGSPKIRRSAVPERPSSTRSGCAASPKTAASTGCAPAVSSDDSRSPISQPRSPLSTPAAATAPPDTPFGEPEQVWRRHSPTSTNCATLLPGDAAGARLARLRDWTQAEFDRLQTHFAARKADGRIRECHGDLHLGNLVVIDGRVTLFDCIEFSEALRWIDVASELAFTYIDLLDHRQPGLACWLLNEWLTCSGDYDAAQVLRFYAVYRALVRAKVAAIRSRQDGPMTVRQAATWRSPSASSYRRSPA